MGMQKWYNDFIDKTLLFTYDVNTNKKVNTVKNIDFYTYTYYNKNLYYMDDTNKKVYKMDWITGKKDLLFTNNQGSYMHIYCFDQKLGFSEYVNDKKEKHDGKRVTGMLLYDIKDNKNQKLIFNDKDIYIALRNHKLKDGFIVTISLNSDRIHKYAYISEDDYYNGNANVVYLD